MSENVFAYGSNMCLGRLRDCGVIPGEQGRAVVLRGYRLLFNKTSTDGSGKANVEAQTDEEVWGVLYTLGEADLRVLDRREAGYYREKTVACFVPSIKSYREKTVACFVPSIKSA